MQADEFWCRAFLAAMPPVFQAVAFTGAGKDSFATQCEDMANAALAVAQRRGMVTGERTAARPVTQADVAQVVSDYLSRGAQPGPTLERVEFAADVDRHEPNRWWIGVHEIGVFRARPGEPTASLGDNTIRIKWGESPPKPIEVWIERKGGA